MDDDEAIREYAGTSGGAEPSLDAKPPVVAIGASAGGLAALKTLFQHVPAQTGMSWVVVVHLAPDHESHLASLLQPHIRMPVQQVTETTPLEPDHVYIIPPNANLNTIDTHLRLSSLEKNRTRRAPIDHFLRTLSETHDGGAIGVILTGTGSDGTIGIKHIAERGGLSVVQDPAEAEFDGMPQSAIATGLVDLVLTLTEIPDAVIRYAHIRPQVPMPSSERDLGAEERSILEKIFAQIRARTGRDFSRYKRTTQLRRIQRRMQLNNIEQLHQYLEHLREEPDEVRRLADDLLITVTTFFRDPPVFDFLRDHVLPAFFEGKTAEDEIRVWSVGCATGEEAYTLAMLLLEEAARHDTFTPRIQLFASDLHERSLAKAREGFYPGDIESQVSPERLKRFFVIESGGYRIRKEVREMVVFAPHNLLSDPPFSRIDLLLCRNLLIYLQRDIQRHILEIFHYALRSSAYLVLGTAESVASPALYRTLDKDCSIYRKRDVPTQEPHLPGFVGASRQQQPARARTQPREARDYAPIHLKMLELYAPPSLLVSPDDKVVHLSPSAGGYLVHPGGEITANVFKLVREELRIELRTVLHQSRQELRSISSLPVTVGLDGDRRLVVLHARPAPEPRNEGFTLVIFDERDIGLAAHSDPAADGEHPDAVRELEAELDLARQRLQGIIEEYENGQEVMKATNEELQSSNEELRSTMEELETSKEELQSVNEELHTLNQENRHKVEELSQLSSDLQNLLAATDIATLFLDRTLRILRFTPKVGELFNVRMTDRGRSISDFTHRLGYPELQDDAQRVLSHLTPAEREVQDETGNWYLTRVLPYRSDQDRIAGVVINFIDITSRKRTELELHETTQELQTALVDAERLQELSTRMVQGGRANQLYQQILAAGIGTMRADMGALQTLQQNGRLRLLVHSGLTPEVAELWNDVDPAGGSTSAEVLRTNRSVLVADVEDSQLVSGRNLDMLRRAGARAIMSIPLITRHGELVGVMSTQWRQSHEPPDRDLRQYDVVARQAADLIERDQGEQALRQLNEELEARVRQRTAQVRQLARRLTAAEQQERQRVSLILHDDLQQLLHGVALKLQLLRKDSGHDQALLLQKLDDIQGWLDQGINTLADLTVELSPPIVQEGLVEALEWLGHQMQQLHGLHVEIDAQADLHVTHRDITMLLFQVVRELLFNVVKHAGTERAAVRLSNGDGQLEIVVRDQGLGFDPATIPEAGPQHVGLYSARERLALLGGDLQVESSPGAGTRVTINTPVSFD